MRLPIRQGEIVALLGRNGVGKTTTIAKLAANYRLREKRRVGLITVDTYRVAAVEQLRTYADIIDLPIRYRARTHGETNISRWKRGWLLLRMTWFAARRPCAPPAQDRSPWLRMCWAPSSSWSSWLWRTGSHRDGSPRSASGFPPR
jgi:energy-coupling factor transporter ATP-binding protein EcfA2